MLQDMSNRGSDPALEPALKDVDSIQNIDTARLALRWALERMRALEKRVQEVEAAAQLSSYYCHAINLTGGTLGSRNWAQIGADTGTQTISGAPAITLTGGVSGEVD